MQLLERQASGVREEDGSLQSFEAPVSPTNPVLQLNGLTVQIRHKTGVDSIIQDISFDIHPGETVALVGESGSGKSVTAGAILGLLPKSMHVAAGQILFQGEDIVQWPTPKRRKLCGSHIGYVFQDYQGSFTPFMKMGSQLVETLRTHRKQSYKQAKAAALACLEQVGLPAERAFDSYPFQLSGGQLQRAALAAGMMLQPALLIADEPTTALDVLTGERVLDLLDRMQRQIGCAVLFISHDLHHVMKRADNVAVMRSGMIVERGASSAIHGRAKHPYTRMLLNAKPLLSEIHPDFDLEDDEHLFESMHRAGGGPV
ncbi:ATP-binding cassette domain-containing protein [Paenibacillus validus]|uniref:ATP-binding cassette domain-containing protein n=1 Tax=Paenibacillus validus TaxID=44253 RepID=UPI003D29558B